MAFYVRTLSGAELTQDKELLAIFEAFKTWRHYLESPHHTIDVITDHQNLEYFSITETLYLRQARWSEYLFVLNMVLRLCPEKLGEKPDSLTRRIDYYLKEGDRDYTLANPQNLRPIITQERFATALRALKRQRRGASMRYVARSAVASLCWVKIGREFAGLRAHSPYPPF